MWGIDDDKSCWLGGILINRTQQRHGYGAAAVNQAVTMLSEKTGSKTFALSYSPENIVIGWLYQKPSFVEPRELEDDKLVVRKVTEKTRNEKGGPKAAFCSMDKRDLKVHPAHATHSAHAPTGTGHRGRSSRVFFFRMVGDDSFGREQQGADRRSVL